MPAEPAEPATPLLDLIVAGREQAITLREAAKLPELARDGRPPGLGLLYRLARTGRLESAVLPGGLCTSRPAVHRLIEHLNDPSRRRPAAGANAVTPRRSEAAARRQHLAALAQLRAAGLA